MRLLGPIGLATRSGHSFDPPPGTNLAVVNFHDVEDWPMLDQIRDYGRSLLYGRHTAKSAARRETPFDEGVLAARMGRERPRYSHPYVMVVLGPSAKADIRRRAIHEFACPD